MQRIMIIGSPGSGKSTLARALADRLDLPVHHMDHIHWHPGWVEREAADKMVLVRQVIAGDRWVFEGGHSSSYEDRLARADLLIWLDLPMGLRLWRVIRRSLRDLGQVRPDMQQGCPEQLSNLPGFVRFIWTSNRSSRARAHRVFDGAHIPRRRFRRPRDVNAYLDRLT